MINVSIRGPPRINSEILIERLLSHSLLYTVRGSCHLGQLPFFNSNLLTEIFLSFPFNGFFFILAATIEVDGRSLRSSLSSARRLPSSSA